MSWAEKGGRKKVEGTEPLVANRTWGWVKLLLADSLTAGRKFESCSSLSGWHPSKLTKSGNSGIVQIFRQGYNTPVKGVKKAGVKKNNNREPLAFDSKKETGPDVTKKKGRGQDLSRAKQRERPSKKPKDNGRATRG